MLVAAINQLPGGQPINTHVLWPPDIDPLTTARRDALIEHIRSPFIDHLRSLNLASQLVDQLADVYLPLAAWIDQRRQLRQDTLIVGVNGAQGSGKSTLCELLRLTLSIGFNRRVVCLSIDDIYKTKQTRRQMAQNVHPLFQTRGVPGTHDVPLGLATLRALRAGTLPEPLSIPRFDKAQDDRAEPDSWPVVTGNADIVLFEGWCVGARPQPEDALIDPVNALEAAEDPDTVWRREVNRALAGEYAELFAELDALVMLRVPDFESIFRWRRQQEQALSRRMSEPELRRFIMHYERLTRYMLDEIPTRADLVLQLNRDHRIETVTAKTAQSTG